MKVLRVREKKVITYWVLTVIQNETLSLFISSFILVTSCLNNSVAGFDEFHMESFSIALHIVLAQGKTISLIIAGATLRLCRNFSSL